MVRWMALVAVGLVLIACGTPDATPTATPQTAQQTTPTILDSPTLPPQPAVLTVEQQGTLAQQSLATQLRRDPTTITLVKVEPKEWADASLGCPDPAMMYAQMLTPGALVTLNDGSQDYAVHTSADGFAVLCENGKPIELITSSSQENPPMDPIATNGAIVTALHAAEFGVELTTISVVSDQAVTWASGAKGCPQPDMMYTTVLTPGFQVVIEQGGKQYFYHSGSDRQFFRCENPEKPADL